MSYRIAVLRDVLRSSDGMPLVIEIARQSVAETNRIVAVEIVTCPPFAVKSPRATHVSYVLINHNIIRSIDFFADMWVLCIDRREHISIHESLPTTVTILEIIFLEACQIVVIFHIIVRTEAQTFTLRTLGFDADDAFHSGIITCSGTRDDLNRLDIC